MDNNKKEFIKPSLDIVVLDNDDIICGVSGDPAHTIPDEEIIP